MANIILPKYKELLVENNVHAQGFWKVEVVNANGEVSQPFGEKLRPNKIQDSGLRILAGHLPSSYGGSHSAYYSIADIIAGAVYTNSAANPDATNISTTPLGNSATAGYSSFNSTNTCNIVTHADGVTLTKVWDFLAVTSGQHTVREICIGNRASSGAPQYNVREYGIPTGWITFSRFILPSNILLETYQFLRLTYSLRVAIPSIVTPIAVPNIQSGTFSGLGKLKLLGLFSNIFGGMTSAGVGVNSTFSCATCNYQGRSSSSNWRTPWNMIGVDGSIGDNGLGAILLKASDAVGSDSLNIDTFAANTTLYNLQGSSAPTCGQGVNSAGLGGSASSESYTAGSNSASRIATVFFPATNPTTSEWVRGIIFCSDVRTPRYNGQGEDNFIVPSPLTIPITQRHGWAYTFYDDLGNPRAMQKDVNFALRLSVRSVVTRS